MSSCVFYIGVLVFGATGFGLAQSPDNLPRFEAASMKPGNSETHSFQVTPGRMTWIGCPLQGLVQFAFRAPQYQLSGSPKWWDSEFYDIVATMPPDTKQPALRLMVQDLLRTRLHLVTHREKKELPVFALMQSPNGPKFSVEKRGKRDGMGNLAEEVPAG